MEGPLTRSCCFKQSVMAKCLVIRKATLWLSLFPNYQYMFQRGHYYWYNIKILKKTPDISGSDLDLIRPIWIGCSAIS